MTPRGRPRIGIIADDLTGANDTALQFSRHGLRTMVLLDADRLESWVAASGAVGAEGRTPCVLAANTQTRAVDPRTAYARVRVAAEAFRSAGVDRVYKKMDSLLRGNPGAELDAVMDAFRAEVAFVAPAFPEAGRTTVDGVQLARGVPVAMTEAAHDPASPVAGSHVPTLLATQARRGVGWVPLAGVEAGVDRLKASFLERVAAGEAIIVVDATTRAHLKTIAEVVVRWESARTPVIAGTAGLAGELPRALDLPWRESGRATLKVRAQARAKPGAKVSGAGHPETLGAIVVIAGSAGPAAAAQARFAAAVLGLPELALGAECIIEATDPDTASDEAAASARSMLEEGRGLIVSVRPRESALLHPLPREDAVKRARRIVSFLGLFAGKLLASCLVDGLVLTGGDTALAVCRELGAMGVAVLGEVLPGVPFGRLAGGPHDGLAVVTKAGGFGDQTAIAGAVEYLRAATARATRTPTRAR